MTQYALLFLSRSPRAAGLRCACVARRACGGVSMPVGSADITTPLDLTGSISGQQNDADVDISRQDRAVIAKAIATARDGAAGAPPFAWNNPLSGNSGTIVALADETVATGTWLRALETTANTIGGVRAYQGIACQDAMQDWAVIQLMAKDGTAADSDGAAFPNG
ncbi:MAG: pyridoxamine 5'-phosphate oxidase [Alphaproteobacteria bacterium]|nr:pyridoxamine 5'-phosphate oxidase [Alphaproteobacteria bacterium]